VRGLDAQADRLEAYRRVRGYLTNPRAFLAQFADEMSAARDEIQSARQRLKSVVLSDKIAQPAIKLIQKMGIDSLRAEISWFEAARAYVAADGREEVTNDDLRVVAPMALRLRRSQFMSEYFNDQQNEEKEVGELLAKLGKKPRTKKSK
jgi:magnesium chelatase subunit I